MSNEIILGDCLEKMKDIPDNSVDLILTDPPYETTDLDFDKTNIDFNKVFIELKRVLKINGWFFMFAPLSLSYIATQNGWKNKFEYVWVKPAIIPATHNTMRPMSQHEMIRVMIKPELKKMTDLYLDKNSLRTSSTPYIRQRNQSDSVGEFESKNRRIPLDKDGNKYNHLSENSGFRVGSTVIYYPNRNRLKFSERTIHPTQKPVAMFELFTKGYCPEGGLVLDPFAGSGTTAIACMNVNRNYICIEKDETYFNIMKERIDGLNK